MYQRLPQNYVPSHYELYIHVQKHMTVCDASVTITFEKKQEGDTVYLNYYDNLVIKSVKQNGEPLDFEAACPKLIISRSKNPEQDIMAFPITIEYTILCIIDDYKGFYCVNDEYFTKFEPDKTPHLLPCFDDPSVRSSFTVKLLIPTDLDGISNMPIEKCTNKGEEEKEILFQKTPRMCTYLLCICIGLFDFIEGKTRDGLPVKMYARKGRSNLLTEFLNVAIFSIEWMESKMKVKYELPHLQLISHPAIKIGMENYGLIALSDYTNLTYVTNHSLTVMHEVSHLWFGDLVSCEWWDSVWLNEGFAQFFQFLIYNDYVTNYPLDFNMFIQRCGTRCLQYFASEKIVPAVEEINFNERVLKSIIYIKGAFTLKMFLDIVGEEDFFKVCSNWLSSFKNKSAHVNDFIAVVNDTLKHDYSNYFDVWLRYIGFPLLNVVEIYDDDDKIVGIRITQDSTSDKIYQFKIPIIYGKNGKVEKMFIFIDEKEVEFDVDYDWILVNDELNVLCAVVYSKLLIEKLLAAKKERKISGFNCEMIANYPFHISDGFEVDDDVMSICEQFD